MANENNNFLPCKTYCKKGSDKDMLVSCVEGIDKSNKRNIFLQLKRTQQGFFGKYKSVGEKYKTTPYIVSEITKGAYRIYFCKELRLFFSIEKKESISKQDRDIRRAYECLKDWYDRKDSKRDKKLTDSLIQMLKNDVGFTLYLFKNCSEEELLCITKDIDEAFFTESRLVSSNFPSANKILHCKKCKYNEPLSAISFAKAIYEYFDDAPFAKLLKENEKEKPESFEFLMWLLFLHQKAQLELDICLAIILGDDKKIEMHSKKIEKWFQQNYKCPNPACKAHKTGYEGNNWECTKNPVKKENDEERLLREAKIKNLREKNKFLEKIAKK